MTNTNQTETMTSAQLFWDGQDPSNPGWWLRFVDSTGTEQGAAIDGNEDSTTGELAEAVEGELHWIGEGTIRVFRGDQPRGTITVHGGKVDWRAS